MCDIGQILNGIDRIVILLLKSKYNASFDHDFTIFKTFEETIKPTKIPKTELGNLGVLMGLSNFSDVLRDTNKYNPENKEKKQVY